MSVNVRKKLIADISSTADIQMVACHSDDYKMDTEHNRNQHVITAKRLGSADRINMCLDDSERHVDLHHVDNRHLQTVGSLSLCCRESACNFSAVEWSIARGYLNVMSFSGVMRGCLMTASKECVNVASIVAKTTNFKDKP